MKDSDKLCELVSKCLENTSSELGVSATYLAACAIKEIDPDNKSPHLVQWGCVLQLRQFARQILRKEYEPENEGISSQQEMFEQLQERYPVNRGEKEYMPRIKMTLEERRETADRFRRISESYAAHANALDAETDELQSQGFFDEAQDR